MNLPCMRRSGKLLLIVSALVYALTTATFAEGDARVVNAVYGTVTSLLPSVVTVGLVLIVKEVYSSLFLGIPVGCFPQVNGSPIDAFQFFISYLHSNVGGNMGILMPLVILSTVVALMIQVGDSGAYGDWAISHIRARSNTLWSTFILATMLGVDDYSNNLTTGSVIRPVADSHRIPRTKLSYVCGAAAAPVYITVPASSRAAAVASVIGSEEVGFQISPRVIPFSYYAVLILVFITVMTCLNVNCGSVRTHELNTARDDLYITPRRPFENATKMKFNPNGKVIGLIIPVTILIIGCVSSVIYVDFQNGGHGLVTAFVNTSTFDVLSLGSLVALTIDMIYFVMRRSMKSIELIDCLPEGFEQMMPVILILYLIWTIGGAIKDLDAPESVAGIVKNLSSSLYALLPAVAFIVVTFLGFATDTSWNTLSILLPIVIPAFSGGTPAVNLAVGGLNNNLLMISIAATLGGVAMGDHRPPIPSTTIMVSSGAQCYYLNHVATQLPYTVTIAVVAFVNYIVTAFIQAPFICLPIAIVFMVLVIPVTGKVNHFTNRHSQRG